MENPRCMAWETHIEPPRIPSVSSDPLNDHNSIGTGVTHPGIYRQFKRTGLDAQIILDLVNIEYHDTVAHWLVWTLVSNETSLYSQHIKGTEKSIVDSLSRDFDRSDQTLTKNFNQILPQ